MPIRAIRNSTVAALCLQLAAGPAAVLAADPNRCQAVQQERDALAGQAMAAEIALARQYRQRLCPELLRQAEQANGNPAGFEPLNIAAWITCRQQAEAVLEISNPIRYRNRLRFPYYSASGAALAERADQLSATLAQSRCQQP